MTSDLTDLCKRLMAACDREWKATLPEYDGDTPFPF
jgi:hypothetical protein